ncbi:MAG TPA: hypothetical protein VF613_15345 [Longimicrobium sp.]
MSVTLLLAVSGTLAGATLLSLGMRLGGRGWRQRIGAVRAVHGVAALCWLVHFTWVVAYSRQYGVWSGLVAFAGASLLIAAAVCVLAFKSAPGRAFDAVLPLLLGFYWFLTFPLLRWRFPQDYFSTDDLGQAAIALACGSAALFLVVYRHKR